MAHTGQIAGRGGDQVNLRVEGLELVLQNHHGEDGGAGGDVTSAYAHGVGGYHASTGVALRRGEHDAGLQGTGRIEQLGTFLGQLASRSAGHERLRKQVLQLPRLGCDLRQSVELLNECGFVSVSGRVNREHAGGIAHAEDLLTGELPVHVTGECGEVSHLGDVLFLVEHGLVQVSDGPTLGDVVLEQLGELLVSFGGVGVLPGAERHQQFAGLVECEVTVHHGGEADVADVRELLAIGGLDVVGHGGVSGLQTAPDLLGGVAPQTIFQMGSPAVVAGGDGLEVVVDEDGLDAGGAEFDAQRGLASANLLGDVGGLLGRVVGCCHIFPLPWSAGVVIPFLGEGVSAHNFQKTLYRQPAFDTTYAVSRIITV